MKIFIAILAVLSVAAAFYTIPLRKTEETDLPYNNTGNGAQSVLKNLIKKPVTQYINWTDSKIEFYIHAQYYGNLQVGTPPQTFPIIFDTGSPEFVVFSSTCDPSVVACNIHKLYNHTQSSTYIPDGETFLEQYDAGSISGFRSKDTVTVGNYTVKNYNIDEVQNITGAIFRVPKFNGIMGLSFKMDDSQTPFFQQYMNEHPNETISFAFYYTDKFGGEGSALTLGGVDPKLAASPFKYYPLEMADFWVIRMNNVTFLNQTFNINYAIVDSGTPLLTGPSSFMNEIFKTLPNKGQRIVDCTTIDQYPTIYFSIGNETYTLTSEDYILQIHSEGQLGCLLGLKIIDIDGPTPNAFIFGDVFMRKYYTNFDMTNKQVGFALAKKDTVKSAQY